MSEKPIIRHCYNCKWCKRWAGIDECDVRYDYIHEPRTKALFCRYYKRKGSEENEID